MFCFDIFCYFGGIIVLSISSIFSLNSYSLSAVYMLVLWICLFSSNSHMLYQEVTHIRLAVCHCLCFHTLYIVYAQLYMCYISFCLMIKCNLYSCWLYKEVAHIHCVLPLSLFHTLYIVYAQFRKYLLYLCYIWQANLNNVKPCKYFFEKRTIFWKGLLFLLAAIVQKISTNCSHDCSNDRLWPYIYIDVHFDCCIICALCFVSLAFQTQTAQRSSLFAVHKLNLVYFIHRYVCRKYTKRINSFELFQCWWHQTSLNSNYIYSCQSVIDINQIYLLIDCDWYP